MTGKTQRSISIYRELFEKLEIVAKEQGLKTGSLINSILTMYIKSSEEKKD
jgi:hypothetical protein